MRDELHLSYNTEPDDTGELVVTVRSKGFAGTSSAWFAKESLLDFARSLENAYPLRTEHPVGIQGGFGIRSRPEIQEAHVDIRFYPIGSVGQVGCRVSLATPIHSQDRAASQSHVITELITNYEPLRTFSRAIEKLAIGEVDEAILQAEV